MKNTPCPSSSPRSMAFAFLRSLPVSLWGSSWQWYSSKLLSTLPSKLSGSAALLGKWIGATGWHSPRMFLILTSLIPKDPCSSRCRLSLHREIALNRGTNWPKCTLACHQLVLEEGETGKKHFPCMWRLEKGARNADQRDKLKPLLTFYLDQGWLSHCILFPWVDGVG